MRRSSRLALAGLVVVALAATVRPGLAHKPITSPYTFTDDVGPILREHCASCHAEGTAAPMSLQTHAETVPWAASMLVELVAGHMPPWGVESGAARFRNVTPMTARDLNVLLTWAAGGTPPGTAAAAPAPAPARRSWRLGTPDLQVQPARDFTMQADVREHVEEFRLDTGTAEPRWLRAVDVLPGEPTIVRRATVSVAAAADAARGQTVPTETLLALWVPGDAPVPTEGAGFLLPAGAQLVLRVHYRKTWQRERDVIRDRSAVGLYFAPEATQEIRALTLEPTTEVASSGASPATFTRTLDSSLRAVAVYPDPGLHGATVTVRAIRPNGTRETLIVFRPQADWARRFWFREPIALPSGTRLEVRAAWDAESTLLPPGAVPRPPRDPGNARLTLNVVGGR